MRRRKNRKDDHDVQEKKKTKDYLEELAEERMDEKARSILVRRLGRRDLEDLEF